MKKYLFLLLLAILALSACTINRTVYIKKSPPIKKVELNVPATRAGYIWVAGHWKWSYAKNRFVWKRGHWIKVKRNHHWKKGHWKKTHRGWIWIPGHWV